MILDKYLATGHCFR